MNLKKLKGVFWAVLAAMLISAVYCPATFAETNSLPAFPGAEGGGMWATGARSSENREVYHVTSLADDGSFGIFRDAVSQPDRIIVFDVGGTINLSRTLTIYNDNLTILGQTAPGDGICFRDFNVYMTGNNIIMRYLRFRMGVDGGIEDDTLGGRGINNVIIDHCSMSWSTDECVSFYQNENFTMQWCIISESLKNSLHDKGAHGYGGIWGGKNASFHHNLLAHHDSRNPRLDRGSNKDAYNDVTLNMTLTDMRNNVVYNWGGNSAYGGEDGMAANFINCYYKYGPSTGKHKSRIYNISASTADSSYIAAGTGVEGWGTDVYVDGNYVDENSSVTSDNTKGVDKDSNANHYGIWSKSNITDAEKIVHFRYENEYPVNTETAEDAYKSVLESAGASIIRDSVDTRVTNDVKNRTGKIIDKPSDVGGYPTLDGGTMSKDSDLDGIPNEYEDKNGLDKNSSSDAVKINPSTGYMYIEEYANALADGSYVRDTAYDETLPQPTIVPPAVETPDPNVSPSPETQVVSEWIATEADINKPAGTEFMPGLVGMIPFGRPMQDIAVFDDGFISNFAITDKNIGGGYENGKGKGSAMEFTAPEDGVFTIYLTALQDKTFYVTKAGVTDYTKESTYSLNVKEANLPIRYSLPVKKGDVYYFYMDGSKARFRKAAFAEYVEKEPVQTYSINNLNVEGETISFNVVKNAETSGDNLIIVAEYNDKGVIQYMDTRVLSNGVSIGETVPYTVNHVSGAGNEVKVFIWDNINNLTPLSQTVSSNEN